MKKLYLHLPIILCLFFFFSCPSEIVKRTYWKGTINSNLGNPGLESSHNAEIYFNPDGTCNTIIYLKYIGVTNPIDYTFNGTYYLLNNFYLSADGRNDSANIEITMNGTLNTFAGIGNGDFNFTDKNVNPYANSKGTWDLNKQY